MKAALRSRRRSKCWVTISQALMIYEVRLLTGCLCCSCSVC
eukprot:09525.XXX_297421_297543_1 [CDS] Oithona nana genome sequencing.